MAKAKAKAGKKAATAGSGKGKARSGHGGARPNSGPRPAAVKAAIADVNAATTARLTEWLPDLLSNLKKLADGVYLKDENEDGTVEYFTCPPDFKANQYLVDRLLGKPTERKEV